MVGHLSMEMKYDFKAGIISITLSTAGKRESHLVLLLPKIFLYSVFVNSQNDLNSSTRTQ